MRKENILCFDIETTGNDLLKDEVQRISVLNGNGRVVWDEFFRSARHFASDNLSNRTVAEAVPEIQRLFDSAGLIVGYNCSAYDFTFLEHAGLRISAPAYDVRLEYRYFDKAREIHSPYRRPSLMECADHYGYRNSWSNGIDGAKATLGCFYGVIADRGWTVTQDEIVESANLTAVLVKPGESARVVEIDRRAESLQNAIGGQTETVYPSGFAVPCAFVCRTGWMLGNEPQNRALCDENGNISEIIRGNFLILGLERGKLTSLTPWESEKFTEYFRVPQAFRVQKEFDRVTPKPHSGMKL